MKLSFRICMIVLLLALTRCDKILNDYGNGNKGLGVNDTVVGVNNTWMGNSNSINGDVNKVVGHQNKIKGSNNIVQGNNNVIGDASPEQILRLQNQMFASFQDRFKGLFNFNSIPQTKVEPKNQQKDQVQHPLENKPLPSKQVQASNNTTIAATKTIQTINSLPHQQVKQEKVQPIVQPTESIQQQIQQHHESILLFRSYGSKYAQSDHQEIYYLQPQMNHPERQLCKRWNYCYLQNRSVRWSFSSIYPQFPSLIEL